MLKCAAIISELKSYSDSAAVSGMARFGINPDDTLGVSIPRLREMAKKIGKSHSLALELWETGIHEARILAGMVDDPFLVTEEQMESWTKDFDSWDVCDQCCMNLYEKTTYAYKKAMEWSEREEEFVKRTGFVLMARLAVSDKKASDECFMQFMPVIIRESKDERNFVRKAVNWALRQIGKRNVNLYDIAVKTAEEISRIDSKVARWIALDALREFKNEGIIRRLKVKKK